MSSQSEEIKPYLCKCGYLNKWRVNEIRQRCEVVLLRDIDPRYDLYSVPCRASGCRQRRRIYLLREGA